MERCNRAFRAADKRLFADFTPEEKQQLTGFFIRMLRNLGVTDPEKEHPPFPPPPNAEKEDRSIEEKERDSQW